ncbi:N-acetylmuramic acid 6-phosphate etherase [Aquibacillus rhizosphaerae]|uniref:N-acetylmuramic acid 6-phosphate etherase n=1 Tax=Aquibacillus rhizosphaerae TaxID=3051431 RepID=A0ABT7L8B1_9BACI|nr:N-acetylmuramic acid 6-phosphate etherase [Aquibacillus sp. LR5S19]MDL4842102.1 N-acetylmuramic acid 6-phosphate etherase [Aquibacillus sp. LR5S19]
MGENVTEATNKNSLTIDEMSSLEIVTLMNQEDCAIYSGVEQALPSIATAIDFIVGKWREGARVFIVGAGTSGRLGIVDAVELGPTFSVEDGRWIGFIAGGKEAMWKALEQHEDNGTDVVAELESHHLSKTDVLIGVSASGSTPYVMAALKYGKELGTGTISISCNHETASSAISDVAIEVVAGPEVIRGSTRLKAGTAQKMVLNMLSTGSMVRLGKVYQNQMVDVQTINKKLVKRAVQTLMDITELPHNEAEALYNQCNQELKVAIFVALTGSDIAKAKEHLEKMGGHLKQAIRDY